MENKKVYRCVICETELSLMDLASMDPDTETCPQCGTYLPPVEIKNDVCVKINRDEIQLLVLYAKLLTEEIEEKSLQLWIDAMAGRIRSQFKKQGIKANMLSVEEAREIYDNMSRSTMGRAKDVTIKEAARIKGFN